MSDEKDPLREQIDTVARVRMIDGDLSNHSYFDAAVQIAYDQDKIAWNRCLDAVKIVHQSKIETAKQRLSDDIIASEAEQIALHAAITYAEYTIQDLEKMRK